MRKSTKPKTQKLDETMLEAADKPSGTIILHEADPVADALKRMHDAIVNEPVPDDFLALLDDIDSKIAARKSRQ